MAGLLAPFLLPRFCVRGSGCGDSTCIHTDCQKQALACGQAGTKATFTRRRDIFLTKMNHNPHHSAASRTEKLRRNRQCGKCRAGVQGAEPGVPMYGDSCIHAAVKVKLTE